MELHMLATRDPSAIEQLQQWSGNVYPERLDLHTYKHVGVGEGCIRLTYVQPPIEVADPNFPQQPEDEHDTGARRVMRWTGISHPYSLLSDYQVAEAVPGCVSLRQEGQKKVSAVMVEFRPKAMLDDCIPLSKRAAEFLLQFRTDPPADPAKQTVPIVNAFGGSDWPETEFYINALVPEVHIHPNGYSLRRLQHIVEQTMIPSEFSRDIVPGWLVIVVHSPGVFICREVCGLREGEDIEMQGMPVIEDLHNDHPVLLNPLPPPPQPLLPLPPLPPELHLLPPLSQQHQQEAQQHLRQLHEHLAQQQAQRQQTVLKQQQRQQALAQQPGDDAPAQPAQQQQQQQQQQQEEALAQPPGEDAPAQPAQLGLQQQEGAAGAAAAEVWPAFRPATYLGQIDGFRDGSNWCIGGPTFAALYLKDSVMREGATTAPKHVQTFLGRNRQQHDPVQVHYGGTCVGGVFQAGTKQATLNLNVNASFKVTAVNALLKKMHGDSLPPPDSWLVLVRRDDGGISAHIWLAGSREADLLARYTKLLTEESRAEQLQEAEQLAAAQAAAAQAAGAAAQPPPQGIPTGRAAASSSDAGQQEGDEEEETEEKASASNSEQGGDEEGDQGRRQAATAQPVRRGRGRPPKAAVAAQEAAAPAQPVRRGRGRPPKATVPAQAAAVPAQPVRRGRGRPPKAAEWGQEEAEEEAASEGGAAAAAEGAAEPSATQTADEDGAAAALGLLRQDQSPLVAPALEAQGGTRQEREAAQLAAAQEQARAKHEADVRGRDARAQARRQAAEAQQPKRRAEEHEAGPSQLPSKRQQRETLQAAAAAALAAAPGPNAVRPPPEQQLLPAAKRQRMGKQQQAVYAALGQQGGPSRQQPVVCTDQQQQQQDHHHQMQQQQQAEPQERQLDQLERLQVRQEVTGQRQEAGQDGTAEHRQPPPPPQQQQQHAVVGAAAVPAAGAVAAAAAAGGGGGAGAQLPPAMLQLLQDALGGHPDVMAALAVFLVSQGMSVLSDLGHVMDSELCAATPGLTPLLVRRLRWLWYVRGRGASLGWSPEEVRWCEADYDAMQDFYVMRAWA